jgi:hypothetical protein
MLHSKHVHSGGEKGRRFSKKGYNNLSKSIMPIMAFLNSVKGKQDISQYHKI